MIAFALSSLVHIYLGVRSRSWTFMIAFGVGAFSEAVGKFSRISEFQQPWNILIIFKDMLDVYYFATIHLVGQSK
jgi:hypothetical protein